MKGGNYFFRSKQDKSKTLQVWRMPDFYCPFTNSTALNNTQSTSTSTNDIGDATVFIPSSENPNETSTQPQLQEAIPTFMSDKGAGLKETAEHLACNHILDRKHLTNQIITV